MGKHFTFKKVDYYFFISSIVLLATGFLFMAIDPVENGFGILTLWIAPFLLLGGFILPAIGIIGVKSVKENAAKILDKEFIGANIWQIGGGVVVFIASLTTYIFTIESTASLWDCSEFIAAAYKLQVPHTPGNPLFLLIGRIFTMFSFGDVHLVAMTMNIMSGLFSALAVLVVYHIILILGARIGNKFSLPKYTLILAAISGSLCMAFMDTFWFSAVEAETYAVGSFFLLFNVWLGLMYWKMGEKETQKRLMVLTAYIVGLSYGIHPMCLLAIPVIAMCWFFKEKELSKKNVFIALLLGFGALLIINRFVAVVLFEMAFQLDVLLVNQLGLPFYSGAWMLLLIISSGAYFLIKKKPQFNVITWSSLFVILGFSSYLLLFIRSNQNPPIDETNPENLSMIKSYMNRESYGSRPLLFGPYYDAEIVKIESGTKMYYKDSTAYKVAGQLTDYEYDARRKMLLPRIYSRDEAHVQQYKVWAGIGENEKPTFVHNLKFLIQYQLGHMYVRYLMWNFSGRVSDIQHDGWLKPWQPIKNGIENKARNQYWMLPFMVGVIGLLFQLRSDKKAFLSTLIFFLITGIILSLYLNSPPQEPRERDYIFVGSFMAFCIWIGHGVIAVWVWIARMVNSKRVIQVGITILSVGLPVLLLVVNFDDHNRSQRTIHMDSARNLLNTCEPNAILFTGGDNDTFPLWYLQEVEGFRTDVRVIVLSYFNTDWYINQLRKQYYESKPFELTLGLKDYRQFGKNDVIYYQENPKVKGSIHAGKYLQLLSEENKALELKTSSGDVVHQIPSKNIYIPVNKNEVLKHSILPADLMENFQEEIQLSMKNPYLEKNALVFLDLVLSNHWERPIYFNYTSMNSLGLEVKPYLVQEGQLFRFLPIKNDQNSPSMNLDKMYSHLVEGNDFENLKNADVYLNHEDNISRVVLPIQQYFITLAGAYYNSLQIDKAKEVMEKYLELFDHEHLSATYADLQAVQLLAALGKKEEAKIISEKAKEYFSKAAASPEYDQNNDSFNQYFEQQFVVLLGRME